MFNSFNLLLLSRFSQRRKGSQDIQSLLARYQSLSIIYLNICSFFIIFFWNIFSWLGYPLSCLGPNIIILPSIAASLYFLRHGHQTLAALAVLIFFQALTFIVATACKGPLTSILVCMTCPSCVALLTSSRRVHVINIILCFLQHFAFAIELREQFGITYNDEQADQILQMQVAAVFGVGFVGSTSFISKAIETDLWNFAQSNADRADKIHKEVMDAVESKDTFASSLSHEIRNPLNAMKGSIDYLLSVVKDSAHLKVLEHAHLSSEVLLTLLNNILDAAKLRSDKVQLDYAKANLIDIVRKIVIIFSDRLREKEINAQIMIDKTIPPTLWIDSSRILQIIINLFSNSLKFTPMQGRIFLNVSWCTERVLLTPDELLNPVNDVLHHRACDQQQQDHDRLNRSFEIPKTTSSTTFIEFTKLEAKYRAETLQKAFESKSIREIVSKNNDLAKRYLIWNVKGANSADTQQVIDNYTHIPRVAQESIQNGFLKIQISDTGSGIEPDHMPNLFERFGKTSSSSHGGTGLGLWITKQLCQKMGGDIKVYSQLGKGTTLVLYIPIYNENIGRQGIDRVLLQEKKLRALVVDDYAYNRDIHKLLLEREGVQVNLACNGKEAVEKYSGQSNGYYDLILMDVQMPEMNGFSAVKAIREFEEEKKWRKANIYIVSGEYYDESEIMSELRKEGGIGNSVGIRCLRKPIDVEIVRNVVKRNKVV